MKSINSTNITHLKPIKRINGDKVKKMKVDKTVIKETSYVIVGTVVLDIMMLIIYSLIESLRPDMIYGAVFGSIAAILNFFFMAYTLQRAVETSAEDAKNSENSENSEDSEKSEDKVEKVKLKVKASYTVRTMVYFLCLVAALVTGWFDVYALLIPSLFPTIVAKIRMIYLNTHGE